MLVISGVVGKGKDPNVKATLRSQGKQCGAPSGNTHP
jgi:hypothetical protein